MTNYQLIELSRSTRLKDARRLREGAFILGSHVSGLSMENEDVRGVYDTAEKLEERANFFEAGN